MVWPTEAEALAWLHTQGVPASDAAVLLRAAGGRPEDALNLANNGLKAAHWAALPKAVLRGDVGAEVSGIAIQSKQFASQQQLAVPLDNLSLSRNLLANRLDWIIANYYDAERVIRITDTNATTGKDGTQEIVINQPDGMGGYMNDMTVGLYDVVVAEVPMQITFENSQFTQALEIRKAGIQVPDWAVIKHSSLSDKAEILTEMKQSQGNPEIEAKVKLMDAQSRRTEAEIDKVVADTVAKNVEAQFGATQAAQTIASDIVTTWPAVAAWPPVSHDPPSSASMNSRLPAIAPIGMPPPITLP